MWSLASWAVEEWASSTKPPTRRSAAAWPLRSLTSRPSPPSRNPPYCGNACFARHARPARYPTLRIVVIYDVGEDNQMAYIAMELVDGPSLHQVLASGRRLDPAETLDFMRQAAAALDHVHQYGIVHRDIKPANIMLHQKTQVKIADFGIAKITFEPKYLSLIHISEPTRQAE